MAIELEQAEQSGEKSPRILRGRLDSYAIYEITEDELRDLETGSPSSLYLNFAIFGLSIAMSFFIALVTATVSDRVFTVFTVLTVVGFLIGACLLILWWRARLSVVDVVRRIRARIPGVPDRSAGEEHEFRP
jgi:uncharacterized membrane protein YciS (DUF1049 family)